MKSRLRTQLLASSPGFTLVEILVSMGILGLAVGLVGSGLFQVTGLMRYWQDDVTATKELRHADSWFATDALNAEGTSLVDGDPPAGSVALTWTDDAGVSHTSTYSLSGGSLIRELDGAPITVARHVVSASFSLSGKVLTFDLEVEAERGGTESMSLQTYMRTLP